MYLLKSISNLLSVEVKGKVAVPIKVFFPSPTEKGEMWESREDWVSIDRKGLSFLLASEGKSWSLSYCSSSLTGKTNEDASWYFRTKERKERTTKPLPTLRKHTVSNPNSWSKIKLRILVKWPEWYEMALITYNVLNNLKRPHWPQMN